MPSLTVKRTVMTSPFTLPKQKKRSSSPPCSKSSIDNTLMISKGVLGFIERIPVLFRVLCILEVIPFKVRQLHGANVIRTHAIVTVSYTHLTLPTNREV